MQQPINFRPLSIITTGKVIPQMDTTRIKNSSGVEDSQKSFQDILSKEIKKNEGLSFSAHSLKRMEDRQISLSEKQIGDIKEAVNKAEGKGVKESLVVLKNVAFIVNIPNKTVITAVDSNNMKENIFTNIDGAVFI